MQCLTPLTLDLNIMRTQTCGTWEGSASGTQYAVYSHVTLQTSYLCLPDWTTANWEEILLFWRNKEKCIPSQAYIQYTMKLKYQRNKIQQVLWPSHVQMLPGIHLCNVSKPKRSSLVKLYIDYLLLKQFQRPEVLSAQMWVQLQSGAQRKINIFLIWFFGNGEMKKKVGKYNVSKTVLVIHSMVFCLFLFWLLFLYTGSAILNLLDFSPEGLLKGKSCRISLQWLKA